MIEILEKKKFSYYKSYTGQYIVFFFNKNGNKITDVVNLSMIKFIQSIETAYYDLPILGFCYIEFIKFYVKENVTSCNDIVVIGNSYPNRIFKQPLPWEILSIFDRVRHERSLLSKKRSNNKQYEPRIPWFANSHSSTLDKVYASDNERIQNQNILMGIEVEDSNLYDSFHIYNNMFHIPKIVFPKRLEFNLKRHKFHENFQKKSNKSTKIKKINDFHLISQKSMIYNMKKNFLNIE